jgi:hypothetical protein
MYSSMRCAPHLSHSAAVISMSPCLSQVRAIYLRYLDNLRRFSQSLPAETARVWAVRSPCTPHRPVILAI